MPREIPAEEFSLLHRMDEYGAEGCNQTEAAARERRTLRQVASIAEKHGLEFVSGVQVRAKISGKRLDDLIRDGDIVIADRTIADREPEEAVA